VPEVPISGAGLSGKSLPRADIVISSKIGYITLLSASTSVRSVNIFNFVLVSPRPQSLRPTANIC